MSNTNLLDRFQGNTRQDYACFLASEEVFDKKNASVSYLKYHSIDHFAYVLIKDERMLDWKIRLIRV